jgi:multicomponent Na+:H+ antiporter subunit D
VFLSAFTTKAAVYALARGFPGFDLLIYLGVVMAIYGVVYAMLENDIRRLLSYHIVSQVGFMVTGVGIGTEARSTVPSRTRSRTSSTRGCC